MSPSRHLPLHLFIGSFNEDLLIHIVLMLREVPRVRLPRSTHHSDTVLCHLGQGYLKSLSPGLLSQVECV